MGILFGMIIGLGVSSYLSSLDGCFITWFPFPLWPSYLFDLELWWLMSLQVLHGVFAAVLRTLDPYIWPGFRKRWSTLPKCLIRIWSPGEWIQYGIVVWALRSINQGWELSYLGFLGPAWLQVKMPKSSSKVLELTGGGKCSLGLFGHDIRSVSRLCSILPGVPRTSLRVLISCQITLQNKTES